MAGKRREKSEPEPRAEKKPEQKELTKEQEYNQHLVEIGAKEGRTWFGVFVKVLLVAWVIGLIMFIFSYLTTGLQGLTIPQYTPPKHPFPL